ncbi:MAG: hypothetical protein ABIE42_10255 [Candidatus Eisenbacteria bacterium]
MAREVNPKESVTIECIHCKVTITVTPDDDGSIDCPECGSGYPLSFARGVHAVAKARRDRSAT